MPSPDSSRDKLIERFAPRVPVLRGDNVEPKRPPVHEDFSPTARTGPDSPAETVAKGDGSRPRSRANVVRIGLKPVLKKLEVIS